MPMSFNCPKRSTSAWLAYVAVASRRVGGELRAREMFICQHKDIGVYCCTKQHTEPLEQALLRVASTALCIDDVCHAKVDVRGAPRPIAHPDLVFPMSTGLDATTSASLGAPRPMMTPAPPWPQNACHVDAMGSDRCRIAVVPPGWKSSWPLDSCAGTARFCHCPCTQRCHNQ